MNVDAERSCGECGVRLGRFNTDTLCGICRERRPLKKAVTLIAQRTCTTQGCGRVLSQFTAGDRCRTCYESQSVAGQQRAVKVGQEVSRWILEKQEQDQTTVEIVEPKVEPVPSPAEKNPHAVLLGAAGGKKGGKARAANMTAEQRRESGRQAANARWQRVEPEAERQALVQRGRPPGSPVDPILVEYLSAGPRSKGDIAQEVARHGFTIDTAENSCKRLGIRSYYDHEQRARLWSLGEEDRPVLTAQRDREKVTTVERERVTITAAEGSIKTVALKGGGQITVNIVADLFRLTAGDRELVIGLVDALNAFEQGLPPPSFHHCACEHYEKAADAVNDVSKDGNCLVCGAWLDSEPHKVGCAQAVLEAATS